MKRERSILEIAYQTMLSKRSVDERSREDKFSIFNEGYQGNQDIL